MRREICRSVSVSLKSEIPVDKTMHDSALHLIKIPLIEAGGFENENEQRKILSLHNFHYHSFAEHITRLRPGRSTIGRCVLAFR